MRHEQEKDMEECYFFFFGGVSNSGDALRFSGNCFCVLDGGLNLVAGFLAGDSLDLPMGCCFSISFFLGSLLGCWNGKVSFSGNPHAR
jgi:hypothetical protein